MAWRNLARAQLLARDHDSVRVSLTEAIELDTDSAAAHYLLGLAELRDTRFESAVQALEAAVRLGPYTAAARFQLAAAYRALGRHDDARAQLNETIELDPQHATAHYQLSLYAQQAGDQAEAQRRRRDFDRLRQLFGDEARSLEALELCAHMVAETVLPDSAPAPSIEIRFSWLHGEGVGASGAISLGSSSTATAAVALGLDAEGRLDLLVGAEGELLRVRAGSLDSPLPIEVSGDGDAPVGDSGDGSAVRLTAGNFQDPWPHDSPFDPRIHSRPDVVEVGAGRLRLLRGRQDGGFDDVTQSAGLGSSAGQTGVRRARWLDADADGDLDLGLATQSGAQLWQNNGNGEFQEVSGLIGLFVEGQVRDLAPADFDGDLALDLVVATDSGTLVFENRRTGLYELRDSDVDSWPPASVIAVDDLDQDGHDDVVLLADTGDVVVLPGAGGRTDLKSDGSRLNDLTLFDYDNDGWLDVVATGTSTDDPSRGVLRLWRNSGSGAQTATEAAPSLEWQPMSDATGLTDLALPAIHGIGHFDVDLDGDLDLLASTPKGLQVLRNDGGNQNRLLRLRLVGTKSNPDGLGARVEVRRGRFRSVRRVDRLPVEMGIGPGDAALDSVRMLWTNGIIDHQVEVPAEAGSLTILEKNVATGSCPFLYAWDGDGFRFVTDILGNSPVGLSIARGVPLAADPDEYVEIGGVDQLVPRDGLYVLQVTEEMREVLYLDTAQLVAVDHPPSIEVHSTDKLMPPPFPLSELWGLQDLRRAKRVESSDGVDRQQAVAELDGRFAAPGPLLPPPLRGVTRPLEIELDFGSVDAAQPWVLALTGWLQYGDASTNIALSQGAAEVIPPMLEVATDEGYRKLDVVVGMPAGKTKTILVDLDGLLPQSLPDGSLRLRLSNTFEIRWDRIVLGRRSPSSKTGLRVQTLDPVGTELAWRGFSDIRSRGEGQPTTPLYADLLARPPWTGALEGWATRYGEVDDLVQSRDARLVLVSAGDALELTFDADALTKPEPGWTRTFFFYSVGWDKDGDLNVIDGDRILPLPITSDDEAWRLRYNTRWIPRDQFAGSGELSAPN